MALADQVVVSNRFQLAIRIDTDLGNSLALDGFICPSSIVRVLETMARHISETKQAAFTWTGPYGGGKSSLAVVFHALLNGNDELRSKAASIVGEQTAATIWDALPLHSQGWRVLPVVGRRARPAQVVGEAIEKTRLVRGQQSKAWNDSAVFDILDRVAKRRPGQTGGLVVFIDEMGKFLEGAVHEGTDIYFFQQLAEMASRSSCRLVVVGILHQAFEEYAQRLSREIRYEWSKIQGRFVDLAISVAPDEQLILLGHAIKPKRQQSIPGNMARRVASLAHRPSASEHLDCCWPLHPVVACLLGPISRRRFGQNQRSLFGFLNSPEPGGFQDFLRGARDDELFTAEQLWDYLLLNLEPSILASPDGHRWATAVEVLERGRTAGGNEIHIGLLKTIAIVDLFKGRSGLVPSLELLKIALHKYTNAEVENAVNDLKAWSLVIYRRFSQGYSIFEGSDFDIERALDEAYGAVGQLDCKILTEFAGLQPIIAKRHYHETGTLRWCDTAVVALNEVEDAVVSHKPTHGSIGAFFLALPSQGDTPQAAARTAQRAAEISDGRKVAVGIPERSSWMITSLARDLMTLEHVRNETPELQGDRIARSEMRARISEIQGYLERELGRALNNALWYQKLDNPQRFTYAELNGLVSDIADTCFPMAPRIHNELLNRVRPSGNAVAARNALLRNMVFHEGETRLGITGYPPEGGLFESLLEATCLYQETDDGCRFVAPKTAFSDPMNLGPAWKAATAYLHENSHTAVTVDRIYDVWRKPPFGIREGLLPVLAVAFIQTRKREVAIYREGIFQPHLTDLDVQFLSHDSTSVQVRWMELSNESRQMLSDMAEIVRDLNSEIRLVNLEPIDVARGLVSIYDQLPKWVSRTQHLSQNAKRVRRLFKQASDPNRFVFDDIPKLLSDSQEKVNDSHSTADVVREGLIELQTAYPDMLLSLQKTLLSELGVPNATLHSLTELRARAQNIKQLSGDLRLEAFILRVSRFHGEEEEMESLISLAINKPPSQWIDSDIDRAKVEFADLARNFIRHEAFAHVQGRRDHRQAMAVVIGTEREPIHGAFEITDVQLSRTVDVMERVRRAVGESGEEEQNVILWALGKVVSEYLETDFPGSNSKSKEGEP